MDVPPGVKDTSAHTALLGSSSPLASCDLPDDNGHRGDSHHGKKLCLSARYLVVTNAENVSTVPTRSHLYRLLEAPGSHLVTDQLPERHKLLGLPHSRVIQMKNSRFDGLFEVPVGAGRDL